MNRLLRRIPLLAFFMIIPIWDAAAVSEAAPDGSAACRAQTDDALRLRCYDRTFGPPLLLGQQIAPPAEVGPPLKQHGARAQSAPSKLLTAKVTALRILNHGAFVATLGNGQVWAQFVAEDKARIAVDDIVTIWPGWAGAYNLKTPSGWITKVHMLPAESAGK